MMPNFSAIRGAMPAVLAGVAASLLAVSCASPSPRQDGAASSPAAAPVPEGRVVEVLPRASSHWAFLHDPTPGAIGRVVVVDGDAQRVLGTIASGYLPTFIVTSSQYVLGETYFSRGSRGSRTDFLTYYDATTLAPTGETPLPAGRFLIGKRFALGSTRNGKFLLSANATPATSVDIIDVASRKRLSEISTPGCTLILPHGAQDFSSLCANGSFLTVQLKDDGTSHKVRGQPFFNPDVDPIFDDWALSQQTQRAYFVSYHGQIREVSLAGEVPEPQGEPWWLSSERERALGWKPGGWQAIEYHAPSHRLFVLMHRGDEWTQFTPGSEIWVFDAITHRRLDRIRVKTPAAALAVTRDDSPLLFTLDGSSKLSTFRETGGHWVHVGDLGELGDSVSLVTVPEVTESAPP